MMRYCTTPLGTAPIASVPNKLARKKIFCVELPGPPYHNNDHPSWNYQNNGCYKYGDHTQVNDVY